METHQGDDNRPELPTQSESIAFMPGLPEIDAVEPEAELIPFFMSQGRYYPSLFSSINIPKMKVKGKTYQYRNGPCSITMVSSGDIPSGLYGRKVLVILSTIATKCSTRERTVTDFSIYHCLQMLGYGHPNGYVLRMVLKQFEAWANTMITYRYIGPNHKEIENLLLIEKATLKLEKDRQEGEIVSFTFTEKGKQVLGSCSIPFPAFVLPKMRSALEFDVFIWLVTKSFSSYKAGAVRYYSWNDIYRQFGVTDPTNRPRFRHEFRETLFRIKTDIYQMGDWSISKQAGLRINPSRPLVPETTSKRPKEEVLWVT